MDANQRIARMSAHLNPPNLYQVMHTYKGNKSADKALIAAEYTGVQINRSPDFEMGVTNKTPEFLKMKPIGKVPVLETPEGPIFESNAIARYISRLNGENSLNGSSLIEYAHIEQWSDFSSLEIYGNILMWLGPRMGFLPYSAPGEEAAVSGLKRALEALNTHLTSNTYLVGHSITLSDIITVCNLNLGFSTVMTKSFTSAFPHVERYFWTLINQPNFKKVVGDVKQTEAVPPVASKKVVQPAKPKEAPKKKEAPVAEAPKPAAKEEEAPKLKPKNPLDLLPPSPMVLDEWKREKERRQRRKEDGEDGGGS